MPVRHNRAGIPSSRLLYRMVMTPNAVKRIAKPLLPERLCGAIRSAVTDSPASMRRPPLPGDIRRRLIADYSADIERLQELIQRDLSGWLD